LYAYCAERGIAHRRCGKLIVATSAAQLPELRRLQAAAAANGVTDIAWLEPAQATALEPALHCVGALLSPSSGIIDSHALMLSLQGDAENAGATVALRSPVRRLAVAAGGVQVDVGSEPPLRLATRWLINCGGLHAPALARAMQGFPAHCVPAAHFAKGNYFALAGRAPFARLVYPVPEPGGLGVHLTLDLGGQARFGPDVEWLPDDAPLDYAVDPARCTHFYGEIRRYWPQLADHALQPAYSGIRPKLSGRGEPAADFRIDGPPAHGVAGVVQLFGIESPGLTASLSIGAQVAGLVAGI
jgi:L-2-hydroxyglutarate oxidase LhgO